MANQLTRKYLKTLGIDDDKVDLIVDAHSEALESIKAERDSLKNSADELAKAQEKVTSLSAELEKLKNGESDAAKIREEFDQYKAQIETEKLNATKENAMRSALKQNGVSRDEFLNLLMKTVDLSKVEMEGEKVKNADDLITSLKTDYAGCFGTVNAGGTNPVDPPSGGAGKVFTKDQIKGMTPEQINANWAAVSAALKN